MARVSIYLLGNFQVRVEDQWITRKFRTDKERALLAYLAMEGERPISRENLAELFWPERYEGVGRTNLRQALLGVRKAIGDVNAEQPLLLVNDENIQLNRKASFWLDTNAFSTRFHANYNHQHTSFASCALCAQGMQEAVDLYRQDFLEGLYVDDSHTFQEWVLFHREQYQRYLLNMLDHLGEFYQNLGELEIAQKYAWQHVKCAPLEERAYRRLMELLALSGRRSAAMEQFQTCQQMLQHELGVEPSPETIQLYNKIRSGEPLVLSEEVETIQPTGLPRPMTDFYGREAELESIERCFKNPNCRLITISGMPGVGKSRLMMEAAQRFIHHFPDGIIYSSLDGIRSPELFLPSMARALGLTITLSNAKSQIYRRLSMMQCLLIIDQFDGMHTSINQIMDLLQNVSNIKLAITSRRRLNLQAANLLQLEGLPYPQDPADSQALQSPAVRLFLNRSQRSRPGFMVDQEILACIVEVCQKVSGVPLALELAADRLRELPIQTIATYLQQGLNVLSTSLQDVPESHRSLEKALLSTWHMIDEPLQDMLKSLTVYPSSFTTESAEIICRAQPEALAALAEYSFLQGMLRGRYALRPLIRLFVISQMKDQDLIKSKDLQTLHADYYLNYLHQKILLIKASQPKRQILNDIDEEMINIRQAIDLSILHKQRAASIQAARDLADYQEAYQALLRTSTGALPALPDIQTMELGNASQISLEQSGFCCDRQDQLSASNNAILIADDGGQITAANFQAQQLSGYTLEALLHMKTHELGLNGANISWTESPHHETHIVHRSGAAVPVDALRTPSRQGQDFFSMYILRKREIETQRDSVVVLEDPLTRLPNRQAFIEQLRKVISHAASRALLVGILVLDVDNFDAVQKNVGLDASQKLIALVSDRLQHSLRQADYLARLGEDEFGVILENIPQSKVTGIVAQKLISQLDEPFVVEKESIQLSASVGVGIYPLDGDHAEALLLHADQARKVKR